MEFKTTYIIFMIISGFSLIAFIMDTHIKFKRGEYNPISFEDDGVSTGKEFIIKLGMLIPPIFIFDKQLKEILFFILMSVVDIVTTIYNIRSIPLFINRKKRIIWETIIMNIFSVLLILWIYIGLIKTNLK